MSSQNTDLSSWDILYKRNGIPGLQDLSEFCDK
jgi:hypothetical protein